MSLPTLDNLAPKEAGGAATKFPGIVADLDTRPNAIGGLSAAELKAKFDEAARVIQNYINNVLLPALLSSGATSIGYQTSSDLPDYRPSTVDDALSGLENLVSSLLPIKNNGKVCFCNNLTIPASGSISVAYNSIYPRPLAGDYVVNQNGEMGHITSVVIGDVVTVTAANYTLKAVLTDETQNLSVTQKARARSNIGALGPADTEAKYVKYDDYASYTDAQKATARANIGALEKANPHVETRMTVDGVLDAEGGIEAYDDVKVEGALTVKDASQENGISLSQTAAAVLSFAGATPQTRPVLRNIAGPVMNNDAATKAYVDSHTLPIDSSLSVENAAADAKAAGDVIANVQSAFDSCFDRGTETIDIRNIDGITGIPLYSATAGSISVTFSSNGSYNTYYVYLSAPLTLYYSAATIASSRFVRLCTVENAQEIANYGTNQYIIRGSNPHEYNRSSGNLPSEANPLTCQAGTALIFTEGRTSGLWELIVESGYTLNDDQVEDIATRIETTAKKNYLKYISGSGPDDSSERVEVYIPNIDGYIRYDFVHTKKASINADVWRVGYAYHTDDSFAEDYAITTAGEWECAVKLSGRSDFSGGHAHGDEVMQNITFIIDGKVATLSDFANMTPFSDLTIIEDSKLFDPDDGTTHFANHGSEHHFTAEGLTVKQSLKFVAAETVATAYMAMLPIAKAVSDYVVPDSTFAPLATTEARRLYNTESVIVYKSDGKVKAVFEVPKFEYLNNSDYTFLCLDNGSTEYNKCYYCNTLSSVNVASGKTLKSETRYSFSVGL